MPALEGIGLEDGPTERPALYESHKLERVLAEKTVCSDKRRAKSADNEGTGPHCVEEVRTEGAKMRVSYA